MNAHRWTQRISTVSLIGLMGMSCISTKKAAQVVDLEKYPPAELEWAIYKGDISKVDKLLRDGWSPNHGSGEDMRSMHPLVSAAVFGNAELIRLLVLAGSNMNGRETGMMSTEIHGKTPLAYACQYGNIDAAMELLRLGADVNYSFMEDRPVVWATLRNEHELLDMILRRKPTRQSIVVAARIAHYKSDYESMALLIKALNKGRLPDVPSWNWLEHVMTGDGWPIEDWEKDIAKNPRFDYQQHDREWRQAVEKAGYPVSGACRIGAPRSDLDAE